MSAPPLSVVADELESQRQGLSSETQPLLGNNVGTQSSRSGDEEDHLKDDNDDFFTKFKLAAAMLNFAISGIVLTGIGVLLPRIEEFYKINDAAASWIFPIGVAGYLVSILMIQFVHVHFGRRGISIICPLMRLLAMAILFAGPSVFPISLAGYFIFGAGFAFSDAGLCAWASAVPYANVVQGFMHGSYSVGAISGPLIAVAMLKKGFEWFVFYRFVALLVLLEFVVLALAFRSDDAIKYRKSNAEQEGGSNGKGQGRGSFSNPFRYAATTICGLYCLVDVGFESCFTDWIVIFMSRIRHGSQKTSSFASSIFWIGMAVGRVLLGPVTEYVGVSLSVSIYISVGIVLQLFLRFFEDIKASLVLLCALGIFVGPLFPSGVILVASKIPRHAHVPAVAAVSSLAQVGAGVAPLMVGFMAERFGMRRFLDVVLLLSVIMLVLWLGSVTVRKPVEEVTDEADAEEA